MNQKSKSQNDYFILLAGSVIIFCTAFLSLDALASGTGMPWENPLESVVDSLTGPVARGGTLLAVLATCLGMCFGEAGSGMKKLFTILFACSIFFAASSWGLSFLGFAGGALI